ncbi:MAG: biotin--[acetyl-CoA-carboxylase] ligase [Bryobacteraceae bacterium]|jgi:BirA family transcriptional regulator, biotin operon repressor / biotin---[acetyl-CoA-carboxylase] ligase
MIDLDRVRSQLADHKIYWHQTIGSTMTEASRLAAAGCESGTVVGADEQTAGQGRYGRAWHSEPGAGLYVSIILRYPFPPDALPVVTLALGLATGEAIFKACDVPSDLRWPNDVLFQSKKCAGILTQLEGSAIIAGIGINVNHAAFPEELSAIATSLRIASGQVHSRERLLVELISSVTSFCSLLEREGREPILEMFSRASSFVFGRRVYVDQGDTMLQGTTAGLNPSGFLMLRGDDGKQSVIIAGGVRPCS